MQTFKVGDKVTCTADTGDAFAVLGLTGVVVHIEEDRIGVDWDGFGEGHNCGRRCQQGRGWYVSPDTLKKLQTFKGNLK